MKTPAWSEVLAFCHLDGWDEVEQGRSPDHRYFRRLLDDGTVLETRVSHSSQKSMSPGRWKAILRDQLQVSEQDFWAALRTKSPAPRPSALAPDAEVEQVPAWTAAVLSARLRMSPEEIAELGRERAIQLATEAWSKPPG